MARRIVVFPVLGRRWAFGAETLKDVEGRHLLSSTMKELLETMRSTPSLKDNLELLTHFISGKMHDKYASLENAPEGTMRHRLHRIGQRLLSRVEPSESFFKAIPKDADMVEIVYPNWSVNPRLVRRRVRHLALSGEIVHQRFMYGSIALLPFTAILGVGNLLRYGEIWCIPVLATSNFIHLFFTSRQSRVLAQGQVQAGAQSPFVACVSKILPLPNVVLAWNVFRAYSHWRALQGSRRLRHLLTDSSNDAITPSQDMGRNQMNTQFGVEDSARTAYGKKTQASHWVLIPSEKLGSLILPTFITKEAISDVVVAEICKEYPLDPVQIRKWRDHE